MEQELWQRRNSKKLHANYRGVDVCGGLVVGVCEHGDDTEDDGGHGVDGQPSLAGFLVAPLVFARCMQNRDAHVPVDVNCRDA